MTSKPEFVHLHNHSEYSLLDGTTRFTEYHGNEGKPSEFLQHLAKEAKAVAFTDHGNLYGALEFYQMAHKVGLKPILGIETYVARGKHTDRGTSRRDNCHLTLLARDYEGFQNLMALSSKALIDGFFYDPRIDKELLAQHSKGIIALSGCLKGEVCQALTDGNLVEAEKLAGEYRDILGPGNYYIEVMDHGLPKQKQVLQGLVEISKRLSLPTVVTNDCHYFKKDDWDAHDARVCISTGKLIDEPERLKFDTHEFYFKSPAEMHALFSWLPEGLKSTLEIADKCAVKIPMDQTLLPHYPVPEGHTVGTYLEKLCIEGLRAKGIDNPDYRKRLSYELGVVERMGFSAYFLIVWDFIKFARDAGIPVGPGRGSGAGALTAYALDITKVDPLKHALLFERFLNPDRKSMPDLDIDFSDEGRERVIEYVRKKYGSDRVAQIITFGSMNARLVVRDVGRVLGMPVSDVDKLAKQIPFGQTIHQALEGQPELKTALHDAKVKKLFHLAKKLEGLKRHTGVHAAGTIIAKDPVVKYAPLAKGASENITTQWDDVGVLSLGLLKVDFLGLRTLSIIEHAVEFVRETVPDFDIEKIPFEDAKSFELLQRADTFGVFQVESPGMRDLMRKLKPTTFDDISSVIALYRPGPMQAGMLDDFVARKHGTKKVTYEHKLLEDILKDTYGCIVFQEQVMEISKKLAGFTPGEADGLRKAMGKKIPEIMEKMRGQFVSGAVKNGVKEKLADKIFSQLVEFGGYGFNKSHTVCYALVAWQTAYLKAHYPVEFMTALLTSEIGRSSVAAEDKENKLATYLEAARDHGIEVRAPDVNASREKFSIERNGSKQAAIRFGLTAIKNVGSGAAESIVRSRADGPYKDLGDLCRRIDLHQTNRKVLESLAKAGALDGLWPGVAPEESRSEAVASLEEVLGREAKLKEDMALGQELLFGAPDTKTAVKASSKAKRLSEHELLQQEKEVLGLYFSGHPLLRHRDTLTAVASHTLDTLPKEEVPVRVAGMIMSVRKLVTKSKGETMARAMLEDLTGQITTLVFPRAYSEGGLGAKLKPDTVVVIGGRLSYKGDAEVAELIAEEIEPIEKALEKWGRRLLLPLESAGLESEALVELKKLLAHHPGPCPVTLSLHTPAHGTALIDTQQRVRLTPELFEELQKALGEKSWRVQAAPVSLPPKRGRP
jgi:DNA polymerase-3 subunit alpha